MDQVDTLRIIGHFQNDSGNELLPMLGLLVTIAIFILGQLALKAKDRANHLDEIENWERYLLSIARTIISGAIRQLGFYRELSNALQEQKSANASLRTDPKLYSIAAFQKIPEEKIFDRLINWRSSNGPLILSRVRELIESVRGNHERVEQAFNGYLEESLMHQRNWAIARHELDAYIDTLRPILNQLQLRGNNDEFARRVLGAAHDFAEKSHGSAQTISTTAPYIANLRTLCDEFPADTRSSVLLGLVMQVELHESMSISAMQYTSRRVIEIQGLMQGSIRDLEIEIQSWESLPISQESWIVRKFRTNIPNESH